MKTFEYVELTEEEMNKTIGGGNGVLDWFKGIIATKN
jgi:bacteriocin-like protein